MRWKAVLTIIGIAIALLIGGKYLATLVVTEPGWIPFAELETDFTNLTTNATWTNYGRACVAGGGCETRYRTFYYGMDSALWKFDCENSWRAEGRPVCKELVGYSGGDAHPIFTVSSFSWRRGYVDFFNFRFKPNLKGKHFRVNYKITYSKRVSGPPPPCSVNINNVGTLTLRSESVKGLIEFKPSVLNESRTSIYLNGEFVREVNVGEGIWLEGIANAVEGAECKIEFINPRWRPLFSCFVDNDEVMVFDDFAEGSTFDINDLSYPPRKFCFNNPPIVRSFVERGIAVDEQGEIFVTLSEGGSVTVKEGQMIRVPYVTKVEAPMLRCPLDKAWNTKTRECEDILGPGLPDARGSTVLPIEIGPDEVAYIEKNTELPSGDYELTPPLKIGDISIQPPGPSFVCSCPGKKGQLLPPEPNASCWKTTVLGIPIHYDETKVVSDYVSVNYKIMGNGLWTGPSKHCPDNYCECAWEEPTDWINVFVFKINRDGLKISLKEPIPDLVLLNSTEQATIKVDNGIANFDSTQSGVKVKIIKHLIDIIEDEYRNIAFTKGTNEIPIDLVTDTLGDITLEVVPYIEILGKKIYGSTKLVLNYEVVKVIVPPECTENIECVLKCPAGSARAGDIFAYGVCVRGKCKLPTIEVPSWCYLYPSQPCTKDLTVTCPNGSSVIAAKCINNTLQPVEGVSCHGIIQCIVDDDCPTPCTGVVSKCVGGSCTYTGECKPSMATCVDLGCPEGYVCDRESGVCLERKLTLWEKIIKWFEPIVRWFKKIWH